jgi:muconate cycloisomerase
MQIVQAEIQSTKIPTVRKHQMAIGTSAHQENVVVRLTAEDGTTGLGEAPHMVGHSQLGETPESVRSVLSTRLIPAIGGIDVLDLSAMAAAMDRRVPGNERAKGAVMMAAYDVAARVLAVPVYTLLGGKIRDRVPLSWSLPMVTPDVAVEEAHRMYDRGWRILKIKAGRKNPADDVELARRLRQEFGDELRIRFDANQAYSVKQALRVLNALEPFDIEFFEQPVWREDHEGMRFLSRNPMSSVPIMADEGAKTMGDIARICRERSADCLSIYIIGSGGIDKSRRIADIAETFGMKGYVGGALESGIGASAGLHLAASSPAISLGCELSGQFLLEADLAAEPPALVDGELVVPTAPGLGMQLNEDVAAHYRLGDVETMKLGDVGVGS